MTKVIDARMLDMGEREAMKQKAAIIDSLFPDKEETYKKLCHLWAMRAYAHRACGGDHNSPHAVMRDLCNDLIGSVLNLYPGFNFRTEADRYGIDADTVSNVDMEAYMMDNAFSRRER